MYTETYLTDPSKLQKRIYKLRLRRKKGKLVKPRVSPLNKDQRKIVHSITKGRWHFCGIHVPVDRFQADHVVSHTRGGIHSKDNYLPSCSICNNYRWHYLPGELQIIHKLGVWARNQVENNTIIGMEIAKKFSQKESSRIKRNHK